MSPFIKLFISSIFMSCLVVSSYAKEFPKSITCTSTVYPPFVIEEDGELRGVDFDLVREAGKRLGIEVELKLRPWKRIESDLKIRTKILQAVVSFFKTPERLAYMDYTSVPTHITQYTLFVRKNEIIKFNHLDDLKNFKGMTIGVNRGFKTTEEFEKAEKIGIFKTDRVNTDKQNFQKLVLGRIDAVLTNYYVGIYNLKKLNLFDEVKNLPKVLASTPAFMVFAKEADMEYLVPEFDKILKQMKKDGTYSRIYKKYGIDYENE